MASLGETFVTKSYAKGQKMIKKSNSKSTVSPSRRGEGSRAKPVAKRVSPSKRGEGKTNLEGFLAMKRKTIKRQEAGVTNLPMSLARLGSAVVKSRSKTVTSPKSGEEVPRTKLMQKGMSQLKSNNKKSTKAATKSGKIPSPWAGPKGFKGTGPVASRQKKAPIKYGKR